MKTRIKTTIVLVLMLLSVFCYGQDKVSNYVECEFIIWLEKGVDATSFATNSNAGIVPKRMLSKRLNIWLFEINDSKGTREEKMRHLTSNADVRVIQNNHTNITLREAIPDDPYYDQQWAPAIMSLPQAWEEFTTGGITATGDTIVVAVIDGGADWTHEDLNCWINTREIPNNYIDDDNNGYVDDYHGWNAYNHNGYVGANRHGTHVSGIIGAVGDNGKGVCGVNWNVKVMSICGSSSDESIVVEAYSYALEMRARYNETNGEEGAGITNTNSADEKYGSAGYGINNIDLGAPGTSIYSTTPNNGYGNSTGTSMATPQVSGTIALMYAAMPEEMMQVCKNDPANFCLSVKQSLFDGADHLPSLDGLVALSRRLNAYGAIENLLNQTVTPTLVGEVNIDGEPVFGQTLTAITDLSSLPTIPDLGELTYQWKRDTTDIEGAVFQTYTLSEDDIDEIIRVQVSAENCIGSVDSPLVGPVRKAEQAMPEAPQMENNTETSITLVAVEGCEYNINGGEWQDSTLFEGLVPNTSYLFTQRKKETRSQYASPISPEAEFCTMPYDRLCENHRSTFKVYPNPANGYVIIEGTGTLTITNTLGQTIMTKEIKGKEKVELPQGMYFVIMGSETHKIVVE